MNRAYAFDNEDEITICIEDTWMINSIVEKLIETAKTEIEANCSDSYIYSNDIVCKEDVLESLKRASSCITLVCQIESGLLELNERRKLKDKNAFKNAIKEVEENE